MTPAYYESACGKGTWNAYCACENKNQVQAAEGFDPRQPQLHNGEDDRRPSHAHGLLPAQPGPNSITVRNYGISTDLLTTTDPTKLRVQGGAYTTKIGGYNARTLGQPPHGPYHTSPMRLFGKGPAGKTITLPQSVPPSRQNTWVAQETYHKALSANLCLGLEGPALVSCAETKAALWPAFANHYPAFTSGLAVGSPEEFTYKRFYDVEHWMDEIAACRNDDMCKAQVSLDSRKGVGIVDNPVTADDPMTQQAENFLLAFGKGMSVSSCGDPNATPPVQPAASLSPLQLQVCAQIQSAPPIAYVLPDLIKSVGGGGSSGPWLAGGSVTPANGVPPSPAYWTAQQASANNLLFNTPSQGYWMQKNPFYDAKGIFTQTVLAAFSGDPAKYASVQRLMAELSSGQSYYYVGKSPAGVHGAPVAKKSFSDEWRFQRAMMSANLARGGAGTRAGATAPATMPGEFMDYAKRKQFLEHRATTWGMLEGEIYGDLHLWAAGKHTAAQQALQRRIVQNAVKTKPTLMGALPNSALSGRAEAGLAGSLSVYIAPTDADKIAWGNGSTVTSPPQLDPAYKYPRLLCAAPDRITAGYSGRVGQTVTVASGGQKASGFSDARAAACNYINAVLDEWARKDSYAILAGADTAAGPSGCFADDPACDWSPKDLMTGLDDLVQNQLQNVQQAQREADYKVAKGWFKKIMISNPYDPACAQRDPHTHNPTGINMCKDAMSSENNFLTAIRAIVYNAFAAIRQVPVLDPGNGLAADGSGTARFGENRQNGENWGNDTFGVGYDYQLQWDLPMQWKGKNVCDFGAGAQGGFEAYAYAFGSDKFDIIKVDFVAGANDAMTGTSSPDSGRLGGELVIAGDSLFALHPVKGEACAKPGCVPANQPMAAYPLAQGSNSETIVEIPFQISFLTLTIKVGIGYSYDVTASVTPTHVNGCVSGQAPSLGLTGTIEPDGDLNAIVDADVGIGPPGLADVGIEVDLTLLGIGLPITAGVGMTVIPGNQLELTVSEGLNMDFHTLDGTMSVFADLLFFRLFDIQILSWAGLHHTVPLFNSSQSVLLTDLNSIGPNLLGPQLQDL